MTCKWSSEAMPLRILYGSSAMSGGEEEGVSVSARSTSSGFSLLSPS